MVCVFIFYSSMRQWLTNEKHSVHWEERSNINWWVTEGLGLESGQCWPDRCLTSHTVSEAESTTAFSSWVIIWLCIHSIFSTHAKVMVIKKEMNSDTDLFGGMEQGVMSQILWPGSQWLKAVMLPTTPTASLNWKKRSELIKRWKYKDNKTLIVRGKIP